MQDWKTGIDTRRPVPYRVSAAAVGVSAPEHPVVAPGHQKRGIQEQVSHPHVCSMCPDKTTLAWMWNETRNRLDSLSRRVNEGKDLDAAREFANYVQWSGMCKLFDQYAGGSGPLKIDGAFLRWKAEELERTVQEIWQSGKIQPQIPLAEVEAINRKLDLIAAHVSKISGGSSAQNGNTFQNSTVVATVTNGKYRRNKRQPPVQFSPALPQTADSKAQAGSTKVTKPAASLSSEPTANETETDPEYAGTPALRVIEGGRG
jgi:hypothetical protein